MIEYSEREGSYKANRKQDGRFFSNSISFLDFILHSKTRIKKPNPVEISEMLKNMTKQFAAPKLPEIPANVLGELLEVGFSETLAKKALYLNDLNVEKAMMWIIDHDQDPTLNNPLSVEQQLSLAKKYANLKVSAIKECVAKGQCTKCATGEDFAPQVWFMCYTCGLSGSQGACESCVKICHQGHNVSEPIQGSGGFYCDCPGTGKCKCYNQN